MRKISALNMFEDASSISDWAKAFVASLVGTGYVNGANGRVNPHEKITRAEFAQVMYNIIKGYFPNGSTYTSVPSGNIMINTANVTLKDLTVNGDLIIGYGAGNGSVILDGVTVTVTGRVIILGGETISGNGAVRNESTVSTSDFAVTLDSATQAITSIGLKSGDNTTVEITLSGVLHPENILKVSYTKGTVESTDGGLLENISLHTADNVVIDSLSLTLEDTDFTDVPVGSIKLSVSGNVGSYPTKYVISSSDISAPGTEAQITSMTGAQNVPENGIISGATALNYIAVYGYDNSTNKITCFGKTQIISANIASYTDNITFALTTLTGAGNSNVRRRKCSRCF